MNIWSKFPFIRLLFPFIVGIIAAVYANQFISYISVIVSILFFIIAGIVLIRRYYLPYKNSWIFGVIVNAILFLLGFQLTTLKTEINSRNHFSRIIEQNNFIHCKIIEPVSEKNNSVKAVVQVLGVIKNEGYAFSKGKLIAYIKKDSNSLKLKYGDEFIAKSKIANILPPQNPGEFDYKKYLSFQNIHCQLYLNQSNWISVNKNTGNFILKEALVLRNYLLDIFLNNNIKGDEYAVASALLLGYEDKLDAEIISAYSSTGALHVLSVSGLHVGIVFIVFNWMLSFFDKMKYGKILKTIILLLLLWFYATLTGLSPSVLRSATMFSFIILAKAFQKNNNIYNTLAVSAFFLLMINPYLIMDVGFQLSYLAVAGIVFLQPKIYNLLEFNNKIIDNIWMISAVSIAAQIATFPLGLHYFHQFPNYFLFSNLIVIPLSTIIIYTGLSIFVFAEFSIVAAYLAVGFNALVWFLNYMVKWMEQLPFAVIEGITITVFETWIIYIMIGLFVYYLINKKIYYLNFSLSIAALLLFYQLLEQHEQFLQKKMIVYNVPKSTAIDFISGKQNVLYADTTLSNNDSKLKFHVKHNWWELGITNSEIVSGKVQNSFLKIEKELIQFYSKKIKIIKNNITEKTDVPVYVDFIIISNSPNISIKKVVENYNVGKVIFDSSNNKNKVAKWIQECEMLGVDYYSVSDSGAFIFQYNAS